MTSDCTDGLLVRLQAAAGPKRCAAGAAAEEAAYLRACAARVQAVTCAQVSRPPEAVWQCTPLSHLLTVITYAA